MKKRQAAFYFKAACFFIFSFYFFTLSPQPAAALSPELELKRLDILDRARRMKAWEDEQWQHLLFYEKTLFGRTRNRITNNLFFISPHGSTSPKLELEADIDGFFFEGRADDSPECLFPERYRYLRKKLNVTEEQAPIPACRAFEEWKSILNVDKASLVFAGGYLNNPSSSYGHTFLRLHRRHTEGADLLDYTMNYAAETGDELGIFYAAKGLFGLYDGMFSTAPYYIKVQEYHNAGSRDLWEFPLNLTEEEMETLLRRAWEMGRFNYPYLFFSKNCSWALLPFLETVRPGIKLQDKFHIAVIPSDTASLIAETFGSSPVYRPSLLNTVKWKRSLLSKEEKNAAYHIASKKKQQQGFEEISAMPDSRKAAVLEYTGDYISWLKHSGKIKKEEADRRTMPVLSERAKLGQQDTFEGKPEQPVSILKAHDSFRISAGAAFHKDGPSYEFAMRGALQDLLDDPSGYLEDSALEMLNLRGRYTPETGRAFLEQGALVRVTSFNPWTRWEKQKSWEVGINFEQARETGKETGNALIGTPYISLGYSARAPVPLQPLFYLLGGLETGFGPSLGEENYRIGGGGKAGAMASAGRFRFNAEAKYYSYFSGYSKPLWTGNIGASFTISRNTALRAVYGWRKHYNETGIYIMQFVPAP